MVVKFEKNLSKFTNTKYCVSCKMELMPFILFYEFKFKKDDEVIVQDMT